MTLEQLFPILLQYAPAMMSAIQNRGYDPGVMVENAGNIFTDKSENTPDLDSLMSTLYKYMQYTDYPDDLGQSLNGIDEIFNQYLKDSDNPNNEVSIIKNDSDNIITHGPEYTLDEITSNVIPGYEYFLNGPTIDSPGFTLDRPNAFGYAKQMFNK